MAQRPDRHERFNSAIAGLPDLAGSRTSMTLHRGMTHLMENSAPTGRRVPPRHEGASV